MCGEWLTGYMCEWLRRKVSHFVSRHLTYFNHSLRASDSDSEESVSTHEGPSSDIPFGLELKYLPAIRYLSFRCTLQLSHLEVMKKCLACPTLTSIVFTNAVRWCGGYPDPRVDSPYPPNIGITHLQYAPSVWREISCDLERRNISAEIALESHCLALIALAINNTAEVLSMPIESAPMARISELLWPRLREVVLCGRYILPSQSTVHSTPTCTCTLFAETFDTGRPAILT